MEKVLEYVRKHRMLETGDKIIVGVSGGADSVCLLFLLKKYAPILKISLEVVHIEHGIRGKESLLDAEYVENLCQKWEIPFHLFRRNIPALAKEWKCSEEEAGRRVRYEAFEEVRKAADAQKIAVAHNQDDQAETILFHLARGSGLRGLCGIFPVRDRIIRPLLCLSRKEIEEILKEQGIAFRVDATNLEDVYTRNKIRHGILPKLQEELNPKAALHIAQAGERLLTLERFMQEESERRLGGISKESEGRLFLDRKAFFKEPEAMQDYLIKACLCRVLEPEEHLKDFEAAHLLDLKKLAGSQSGRFLKLWNIRVETEGDFLVFQKEERHTAAKVPENTALPVPGELKWGKYRILTEILPYKNEIIPEKIYTKWFDYDTISGTIQLRTRQKGDFLTVTAQGGTKTLKKYFIDEKIPADQREKTALLADGEHILWVVGYRISESYKVSEKTKRVLKVQVMEE